MVRGLMEWSHGEFQLRAMVIKDANHGERLVRAPEVLRIVALKF
jgi:hypothetical protein